MKWIIASPYQVDTQQGFWSSVQQQNEENELIVCQAQYKHNRSRSKSSKQDWLDYWNHASQAWKLASEYSAGIVTAFPQLPVCTGIKKRLTSSQTPILATTFNLGGLHGSYKQALARFALKNIDGFIVHSTAEITHYSQYLNLAADKFHYIPLHKTIIEPTEQEEYEMPFILAMGSANRDYNTLFRALEKLKYPLTIVAPKHVTDKLTIPDFVTVKSNLTLNQCRALVQKARLNIIPIDNDKTASGQVTLIEAMMFKKAVIATDTIGTRDYIQHGQTGLLTPNNAIDKLSEAIEELWTNSEQRNKLAGQAQTYIKSELNHKKTAARLTTVMQNIKL